ncbi:MAG: hypothetical protein ACXADH_12930, partial [Candidatus Kariarchaeaceae archaeon]
MGYDIKTYQEGFIKDQFKIGSAKYDKWRMGGQTRIPQLNATYSQPDFDPKTRFYAFSDKKMVGFLTAAAQPDSENASTTAFFEFPYSRFGYEDCEPQLIEHAISTLRSYGINTLVTRAGEYWGKTEEYAKKLGFTYSSDIVRAAEIDINKFEPSSSERGLSILPFNFDAHHVEVADLVAKQYQVPLEQAKQSIIPFQDMNPGDSMKNPWDQELTLVSHLVVLRDEKVVARILVMNVESFGPETANIRALQFKEGNESFVIANLISSVIGDSGSRSYTKLILHTGLWG